MAKEERIGNARRDLVLETANSVRVLRGDKYYTIDFEKGEIKDKSGNTVSSNFIVTDSIINYQNGQIDYPGENKIIFAKYSGIFYTENQNYIPLTLSSSSDTPSQEDQTFTNTVSFEGFPAFKTSDRSLIINLNAQYLDGHPASDFVLKTEYDEPNENNSLEETYSIQGLSKITEIKNNCLFSFSVDNFGNVDLLKSDESLDIVFDVSEYVYKTNLNITEPNTSLSIIANANDDEYTNPNLVYAGIKKNSEEDYLVWVNSHGRPFTATVYINKF